MQFLPHCGGSVEIRKRELPDRNQITHAVDNISRASLKMHLIQEVWSDPRSSSHNLFLHVQPSVRLAMEKSLPYPFS